MKSLREGDRTTWLAAVLLTVVVVILVAVIATAVETNRQTQLRLGQFADQLADVSGSP